MAGDLSTVVRRRVTGPGCDRDRRRRFAESCRGQADAGQGRLEVSFDVVGQRLQRRDVENADMTNGPSGGRRARFTRQAIQAPEERGQGFAAPRWGMDQGVMPGRDRLPTFGLSLGRSFKAGGEPLADGRREPIESDWTIENGHGSWSIGRTEGFEQAFD